MTYIRRHSTEYQSRVNVDQSIERRILDALIYIVHTRKAKPKAIYLTPDDLSLLEPRYRESIDGLPVRVGKQSMLYSESWWGRRI